MKDVFDCNPELTFQDVQRWYENEDNPKMREYLAECIDRKA